MDVAQYGGRIVNPAQAQGQIAGGSLMGLGFALSESLDYTDGQPANGDWGAYLIPTLADAPLVNCEFPDLLEPGIPQGFNGIAEIPHVQAPAAVLSALRAATGHELPRAPATPARIAQVRRLSPCGLAMWKCRRTPGPLMYGSVSSCGSNWSRRVESGHRACPLWVRCKTAAIVFCRSNIHGVADVR
jgi:hypothetical protein